MFLASLARASRPQLISRGSSLHIFSAGAGVDRLARRCATRRLLCAQAQPAQSGEADEASPPPPTRVNFRQPMLATRPSMTAHARWLRMDAALKIVAAEGCSLEEAETRVMEKAVEEKTEPGVVGAVMNVLRERGPLKTEDLFVALKASYPGAAAQVEKRGTHLIATRGGHALHKRKGGASSATIGLENICDYPLRNQLMKIRSRPTSDRKLSGYEGKDTWAVRKSGQVRRWHARSHKFFPNRGRIYGHHA